MHILDRSSSSIRVIFWDWGGVCCHPGEHFSYQPMLAYAGLSADEISAQSRDIEKRLYRGEIDDQQFWSEVTKRFNLPEYPLAELRAAYQSSYHVYQDVLDLIRLNKETYRMVLLSNLAGDLSDFIEKRHGLAEIFDELLFSHRLGMMKPDLQIFNHALARSAVRADQALFIDDSSENIDAAAHLGLQTLLVRSKGEMLLDLNRLGLQATIEGVQ